MTGLSGAGKTTIATQTMEWLAALQVPLEVIDGDIYRKTLCKDLGFSPADRMENIRRLGALAHSCSLRNIPVIISAINPYESARARLKAAYGAKTVWVDCPLAVLMERDTKGLYRKALLPDGHPDKVMNLTGINDRYEAPENADLVLHTGQETPEESVEKLTRFILSHMIPFPIELPV